MNLAIFLSGTGTNFRAIAAAIGNGDIPARITLVASNKPDAPGLDAAKMMGFNTLIFQREEFPDGSDFAEYMLEALRHYDVQLIILAGYLRKIPPLVVRAFRKRIINIHPAMLPDFGGKGMYGMNVHRAVIGSGIDETGVTVHYVDEKYDHGEIIAQQRVPVLPGDTPETLAVRVLKVEHEFYPQVIKRLVGNQNSEL